MKRYYDDEDRRPNWALRLVKGILVGAVVSGTAVAAISIFVLPPPAPHPKMAEQASGPKMIDGIEVASEPAYFGTTDATAQDAGAAPGAHTTAAADAAGADAVGPVQLSGPALVVNAAAFQPAAGKPLVAVVLDDVAADPMLHDRVFGLKLPVTIGVVCGGPGDQATARAARAAGYEVVAELPIMAGGASAGAALEYDLTSDQAAERTALLMRRLPMAVAATSAPATMPPGNALAQGIMKALGPFGFAYLARDRRSGAAAPAASGLDRITAVSDFSIPAKATAAQAHAVLDHAAAEAAKSGGAVVMAAADRQVLLALELWAGSTGGVAQLAPLSAVVKRLNGGEAMSAKPVAAGAAQTVQASSPAN